MAALAKWIGKGLAFAAIAAASGVAGVEKARSSIPKPPENPELTDLLVWVLTFGDPLALLAAVIAAVGTGVSLYTFVAERPATRADLDEVIQPLASDVNELSGQVWAEGQVRDEQYAETLAAQQETRDHTSAVADRQTSEINEHVTTAMAAVGKQLEAGFAELETNSPAHQSKGFDIDILISIRPAK